MPAENRTGDPRQTRFQPRRTPRGAGPEHEHSPRNAADCDSRRPDGRGVEHAPGGHVRGGPVRFVVVSRVLRLSSVSAQRRADGRSDPPKLAGAEPETEAAYGLEPGIRK